MLHCKTFGARILAIMNENLSAKDITIVTVCRNRSFHLEETAPRVSRWPFHGRHIIVDWNSDSTIKLSSLPDDPRILLVHVRGESSWNPALAYNFAVSLVLSRYVMRMDADCWPEQVWDPSTCIIKDQIYVGGGGEGRFGQFLMPTDLFRRVGGFNEYMRGWGFEDKDLRYRIEYQFGCVLREISNVNIGVITHSNFDRVSGHGVDTSLQSLAALRASRLRNRLIAAHCPFGALSAHSSYLQLDDGSWSLQSGSRPELPKWLQIKVDEALRRCFWTSYLALPEVVVELLPVRLLPSQANGRWKVSWWHRLYAMTLKPTVLIPVHLLSLFRGFASRRCLKLLFRRGDRVRSNDSCGE